MKTLLTTLYVERKILTILGLNVFKGEDLAKSLNISYLLIMIEQNKYYVKF